MHPSLSSFGDLRPVGLGISYSFINQRQKDTKMPDLRQHRIRLGETRFFLSLLALVCLSQGSYLFYCSRIWASHEQPLLILFCLLTDLTGTKM